MEKNLNVTKRPCSEHILLISPLALRFMEVPLYRVLFRTFYFIY